MSTVISLKKFFWDVIKPYQWMVVGLLMTSLYWAINNSLSPYVLKLIIDHVVTFNGNKALMFHAALPYIVFYMLLWILIATAMRANDWFRLKLLPSVRADVTKKLFSYLMQHSHHYFQNNFAGSLSNKISDMISGIVTVLSTVEDALAQCAGLVIAILMMLTIHPIFALVLMGWAMLFILIAIYFFQPIQQFSHVFATAKTTLMGKVVDSISNVASVRLFARHAHENKIIEDATWDTVVKDRHMQWYLLKMRIFWDLSIIVLIALNLVILIIMYSKNLVSIGDFTFIISLSISVFLNLWHIASQFVTFAEELGRCKQAITLISAPHGVTDLPNAAPLVVKEGGIAFNDVTFHYDEGIHLFKNKNIVLAPGKKVGLVGFSGSGKSTFVSLILRLFDVESGEITIDGQNIRQVTQDSLRKNIALIPQDISLFHRTLLDNIRYGEINASDEAVIEAAKKAQCHEFIIQLPQGYQSLVGERGIKLSGGQRQLIAIARAILKNAPLLMLDEATSSLDSVTEKYIQAGLHWLMKGRTTIVIAHRLSTLAEMDRILVFEQGCIIEDGSHHELMQSNGHYANLWKMQAGGFLLTENDGSVSDDVLL